jgi:hypothetical protein
MFAFNSLGWYPSSKILITVLKEDPTNRSSFVNQNFTYSRNCICPQVRHGPKFYNCTMKFDGSDLLERIGWAEEELLDSKCSTAVVNLAEDDQGLAPGQYTAFYQDDVCLGSGIIVEALGDDKAVNVSPKALEAAKVCNNPEFLKGKISVKDKVGKRLRKDGAAQDKSLKSKMTKVGQKDATEDHRHDQSRNLSTEKHSEQSAADWWPFSMLARFVSWIQK